MTVLGFDPSLTCSGFAYEIDGEIHTGTIKTRSLRGNERLDFILHSTVKILDIVQPSLIVYEGYSMGSPKGAGRSFDIGEMGGLLKHYFWKHGLPVFLVPPSNLKQFATTKGNSKKPEIMKAIADVWGYRITQEDESDAFVLMKMGEAKVNRRRLRTYDEKRRTALGKCELIPAINCN